MVPLKRQGPEALLTKELCHGPLPGRPERTLLLLLTHHPIALFALELCVKLDKV